MYKYTTLAYKKLSNAIESFLFLYIFHIYIEKKNHMWTRSRECWEWGLFLIIIRHTLIHSQVPSFGRSLSLGNRLCGQIFLSFLLAANGSRFPTECPQQYLSQAFCTSWYREAKGHPASTILISLHWCCSIGWLFGMWRCNM